MRFMRIASGCWSSAARVLAVTILAIGVSFAVAGVTAAVAHADDLPFWEKGDQGATGKVSKSSYKKSAYKSSGKSYASKKKLGGYAEATEPVKKKKKGVKVAALHGGYYSGDVKPSLSGGSVRWAASSGCLDGNLKAIVFSVASNFGPVTVNSTCRSRGHNRAVGGAPRSKHLSGDAVDFRVHGNIRGVYAYLRSNGGVGGLKHYGGGLFHIDNGDRRTW